MARITPSSNSSSFELPEHEPITVELVECAAGPSAFQKERRVVERRVVELVWQAVDHGSPGARPRIWETATISVSDGPSGPAKLKRIINAAHGRDKTAPIAWVDDETLRYSLDGCNCPPIPPCQHYDGQLAKGLRLVVRGENEPDKKDPARQYLRIRSYAPVPGSNGGSTHPTPPPAPKSGRPSGGLDDF